MGKAKRFSWHGVVSSGGTVSLSLYFPCKNATDEEKQGALAAALAEAELLMFQKGYLPPQARLMSSRDIAREFGHTRQYWEKLLREEKIPFKETAAGRITCDLWVEAYLKNKEAVDEYVRSRNKALRIIDSSKEKSGIIGCPQCGEQKFHYFVNLNNINGLCRAGCGFRIHTTH